MPAESHYKFQRNKQGVLIIACGALAKEVVDLVEHNKLRNIDIQCLPAQLHHRPQLIPAAIEKEILERQDDYQKIYVVYGDCGTAGGIDKVLDKYAIERIAGPHCFSFFHGNDSFMQDENDITSFFLTDFFCLHFDKFIWQEYGLDRGQNMIDLVFGNYKKVVLISQTEDPQLICKAAEIAQRLGLQFERRHTGYADLGTFIGDIQVQTQ
jgi:hypothetical protein